MPDASTSDVNKLIITTDDYGPVQVINDGVLKLVANARVNSVNVLVNYGDPELARLKDDIRKLLDAEEEAMKIDEDFTLEIGCHLTITSGKPLSNELVDPTTSNRNLASLLVYYESADSFKFMDYLMMSRASAKNRSVMTSLIKAEINAQYDRLSKAIKEVSNDTRDVSYINSHHNALIMWPEYSEALMEKTRAHSLPTRSAVVIPKFRENIYRANISINHLAGLSIRDRREYRKHQRALPVAMLQADIETPAYVDSRHYGPLPIAPVLDHLVKVNEKRLSIYKAIKLLNSFRNRNARVAELLLHVADSDGVMTNEDKLYNGVNPRYLDGRQAEFDSLMSFPREDLPPFGKWSALI